MRSMDTAAQALSAADRGRPVETDVEERTRWESLGEDETSEEQVDAPELSPELPPEDTSSEFSV